LFIFFPVQDLYIWVTEPNNWLSPLLFLFSFLFFNSQLMTYNITICQQHLQASWPWPHQCMSLWNDVRSHIFFVLLLFPHLLIRYLSLLFIILIFHLWLLIQIIRYLLESWTSDSYAQSQSYRKSWNMKQLDSALSSELTMKQLY